MSEFLQISDSDGVYLQHCDEFPLPLMPYSPLPDGWLHTGRGWDYWPTKEILIEIWHCRRVL